MTLSPWLIYFADIADKISGLTIVLPLLLGIALMLSPLGFLMINDCIDSESQASAKKTLWKIIKTLIFILHTLILIHVFTPSTETIYKMLIIPPVINSQVVQKLPDELQLFIDKELMINSEKGEKPSE